MDSRCRLTSAFWSAPSSAPLGRADFQIVDIGIQDAALFPGAAGKVDGRHFQHLHISVVTGVMTPCSIFWMGK